jgi:1,4-alpha-glucan branching enzyme
MEQGLLAIILHAHLPFVRHPEYPEFLEEDWLYEAISETYLPLLSVFENCALDAIPVRVTMGLTPPLCEMLSDPLLQDRYLRHVNKLVELCEKEVERTRGQWPLNDTAQMYLRHFTAARSVREPVPPQPA